MAEPIVYLNHEIVPATQAHVKIHDAGVVWGATVTEMVRTFHHRLFRLDEHLARLARSLRYVRLDIGRTMEEFTVALDELVQHNARLLNANDELGLVIFVTAGEIAAYVGTASMTARATPTVCAHTFPLSFASWAEKMQNGAHVVTPSIRHVPPQCVDPKMKYRSRMHYYLAGKEAELVDPHAIPLLLDLQGNATETSGANFVIVEHGTIVSPTTRNILPGISRQVVIELAEKLDIPFVERDFQVFNIVNADEACMTSTPYCMLPVTRVNGLPIGSGVPGPIFRRLMNAWNEEVGLDVVQQIVDMAKLRCQ